MPANTEHPAVAPYQPTDQEVPIWRYLSLAKLISLLQTRCLPFANCGTQLAHPPGNSVSRRSHLPRNSC